MIEQASERLKNELALAHDFDPTQAFRLLAAGQQDIEASNILRFFSLEYSRHSLIEKEASIFVRRYGQGRDKLCYSTFAQALLPQEPIFADYFHRKGLSNEGFSMSAATRDLFLRHLETLITNDVKIQLLRESLRSSTFFSIKVAFFSFDLDQVGGGPKSFGKTALQAYLRAQESFVTERELSVLFHYLDRDGDGRISYTDFYAALLQPLA